MAPSRARGTVTIALVTDREINRLNRQFRGKDAPTDVLSFPVARPLKGRQSAGLKGPRDESLKGARDEADVLGEIAIALGVARRQARERGHSEAVEWRVLALHGLLHLLGYDHETDDGRMQRVERRLRRKGGLREGLIERADS